MEESHLFNKYKYNLYINRGNSSNRTHKINKHINIEENFINYQFNNGTPVFLNIYHITKINLILEYLSLSSYHTTIEIHSFEFSYGESQVPHQSGINRIYKKENNGVNESIFHLKSRIFLGFTLFSQLEISNIVEIMGRIWTGISYCPFNKNCNDFTKDFAEKVLLKKVKFPIYINRFKALGCCFYVFFRPLQAYSEMKKKKNFQLKQSCFEEEENKSNNKNSNLNRINKSSFLYLKDNSNVRLNKIPSMVNNDGLVKIKGQDDESKGDDEELLMRIVKIIQDLIENLEKVKEENKKDKGNDAKVYFLISHFRRINKKFKEIQEKNSLNSSSFINKIHRLDSKNSNIDDNSDKNISNNSKINKKSYIIKEIIKEIYEFLLKFYEMNASSNTYHKANKYKIDNNLIKEYSFSINQFLYIIHNEIFNIQLDVNELIRIKELYTDITRILYLILNEIHLLS